MLGDRYYSNASRIVALVCVVIISFVYISGQLRGVGIIFSRYLEINISWGIMISLLAVLLYTLVGGLKGGIWTQAVQYLIIIFGYLIPAFIISYKITGNPIPQISLGSYISGSSVPFIQIVDQMASNANWPKSGDQLTATNILNLICITLALMVGTAGLPHIIAKFYTVSSASTAQLGAAYALLFIALLYTTAPAVGYFSRYNIENLNGKTYALAPDWVHKWEKTGLITWDNKNTIGKTEFKYYSTANPGSESSQSDNRIFIDPDILVLANPEMNSLPPWVTGLLIAGALIAALSTSAGLLLIIGSTFSHDLYYRLIDSHVGENQQTMFGYIIMIVTTLLAGICSLYPPAPIAPTVAYAFGLAASSFFPILVLGIFWRRATSEGAIAGMIVGITFTGSYILEITVTGSEPWFFGISPEGIGAVGMVANFLVTVIVSKYTAAPPMEVQELVESIKNPSASIQPFGSKS